MTVAALDDFTSAGLVRRGQEAAIATDYFKRLRIRATGIGQAILRLSGGNQQKALIARALIAHPKVILFNEPTEGVDVGAKIEIYGLIRDFVASGGAAIVRTSDLVELLGLSDRVLEMRKGRIVGEMAGLPGSPQGTSTARMEEDFMALAAASN